jgi:hypothetical protein
MMNLRILVRQLRQVFEAWDLLQHPTSSAFPLLRAKRQHFRSKWHEAWPWRQGTESDINNQNLDIVVVEILN